MSMSLNQKELKYLKCLGLETEFTETGSNCSSSVYLNFHAS